MMNIIVSRFADFQCERSYVLSKEHGLFGVPTCKAAMRETVM